VVQVAAAHHVEAPEGVDAQGERAVEDKILAEEVEAAMGGDHFDKEYCPPVYGGKDKHLQIFRHPDPVQIFSHMFCHPFLVDILKLERNKPRHSKTFLC